MTSNPAYRPSEGKREEFRKYLEKTGVMDALTRVLVCLYEEADKPEDALGYIRNKLSSLAGLETPDELKEQLDNATCRIQELEEQIKQLTATEAPPEGGDGEGEATGGEQAQAEEGA